MYAQILGRAVLHALREQFHLTFSALGSTANCVRGPFRPMPTRPSLRIPIQCEAPCPSHYNSISPLLSISLHHPSYSLYYFTYTLFHSYTLQLKRIDNFVFLFFRFFLYLSTGKVYTDRCISNTPPVSIYTSYKISCHPLFLQQKHILSKVCIFAFLH